ncbi:MAG: 16S rRNA (cytosine(1402)-N(4))-methyltransferase RsmH [Bacteroidales bacterium]|nr:16S rRNA (cytosine(1402)-N(4))-methyltransferase RsmH [Bacteroidales bacterium]MDD3893147.1 16S rRNA (cytosine(1402)-N(4))-methyltransferase RsmH [Bacteroidales bacterium]
MEYHIPVLLHESVEGLNINPDGTYLDMTFGGGGHSREIIKHLSVKGRLFAFDHDEEAFANAIDDSRFTLIRSNFRFFRNFLKYHKIEQVDGILADLGVSSKHFDSPERGFSFRFEGPLDMRMNRDASLSAIEVVNNYDEKLLTSVLSLYGELPNARKISKTIISQRESKKIVTVEGLAEVVSPLSPPHLRNKMLAKVFQAIRIEVNSEMEALKQMLIQTEKTLQSGGRLVVLSYHSLEDRLVKNFIRAGNFKGNKETDFYGNVVGPFNPINRRVMVPTDKEIEENPRARSAKLRIAEKR